LGADRRPTTTVAVAFAALALVLFERRDLTA